MEEYNLQAFAEELKKQRNKKKITLLQIRNRTRIDLKYLEAIESANFDVMPEVYMRAFLREYAESVGLDPKETLAKYDAAKEGKLPEKTEEVAKEESTTFTDESLTAPAEAETKKPFETWVVPVVAGVSVVLLFIIVYFAFFNKSEEIVVTEKPYEEIVKENQQRFEEPPQEKSVTARGAETDNMVLKIVATDTSWVQVTIDGDTTFDFILYPGRVKKLRAGNYFETVLGNSGGIKFLLNSDTLDFRGEKHKVRRVRIDQNGYRILKPKKKDEQG